MSASRRLVLESLLVKKQQPDIKTHSKGPPGAPFTSRAASRSSLSRWLASRPCTLPSSCPALRKHLHQVVLSLHGCSFPAAFLPAPVSVVASRQPISVPALAELHSYYPQTSLRFRATPSLARPISPRRDAASHIRRRFRPPPPLCLGGGLVPAAARALKPSSRRYFIAFTLSSSVPGPTHLH